MGIASVSVVALALLLVQDALTQTESTLRAGAERELAGAANELRAQYEERAEFSGRPMQEMPIEAQDLSLRGLSQTVLRSYNDVKGGFYDSESGVEVGAAGPRDAILRDTILSEEREAIEAAVRRPGSTVARAAGGDLLVATALATSDRRYAWALKRLIGVRDPVPNRRRWLLATLVLAAVAGVAGVVSILVRLRSGVEGVKQQLKELERDFTFRTAPGSGDFGEIHAAIGSMADRRMELETTVREQDRLAALGRVVAGVAHEIRNPLNSMRLQLELVKRRMSRGIATTQELDTAMDQVDRLNSILGQLLAFGKPNGCTLSPERLLPLVERSLMVVQDRARAKGIAARILADEGAGALVYVDGVKMEQVLTNLLLNAIEASPERAEVSVRISDSDESVEVAVIDQGPGIAEAARDHVFDAFFTTRPEGTGLGLSVSREIVAAHRGFLRFETSDRGTTFIVRLPRGGPQ